jgi:predicted nucleotidyltransferase
MRKLDSNIDMIIWGDIFLKVRNFILFKENSFEKNLSFEIEEYINERLDFNGENILIKII